MFELSKLQLPSVQSQPRFRCSLKILGISIVLISLVAIPGIFSKCLAQTTAQSTTPYIYWGSYINGSSYGINPGTGTAYGNTPWDSSTWDLFEQHAGRKISILHWGISWYWASQNGYTGIADGHFQRFYASVFDKARVRGAYNLVDWSSWDLKAPVIDNQPTYSLANIINGNFDDYIRAFATDAKVWGHPFFLRFNWEMNGNWYPWSELTNGNAQGEYILAWRHVHDIFTQVGATNVSWVWCPNISSTNTLISTPIDKLYPGDNYVDWTCVDVYNKDTVSLSLKQLLKGKDEGVTYLNNTYQNILDVAPTKPMMIGETASREYPLTSISKDTTKANWITDTFINQIPTVFPNIRAVLWFNWNSDSGSDYIIESSVPTTSSFNSAINSGNYTANIPNLDTSPIPVLNPVLPATDTQNPTVAFLSPLNNSKVKIRNTVNLTATASDNVGVTKVKFYVNNINICVDTISTYNCPWQVPRSRNVRYTLSAEAYDAAGNIATNTIYVTSY